MRKHFTRFIANTRTIAKDLENHKAVFLKKERRSLFSTTAYKCQESEERKQTFRKKKIFRSSYPTVDVPKINYPQFALSRMEKLGQKIFLVNGETGEEFSYHASLREICRVSSGLIRRGLHPGDRVAFFSFNRPEYVLAWFAAAAVGAVVTDANPTFTSGELRTQLENTNAKYLFVHQLNIDKAKEAVGTLPGVKEIYVFGNAEGCVPYSLLAEDAGDLFKGHVDVDPLDILHLPCSSGTTGLPKAVMRTHQNLVMSAFVTDNDNIRMFPSETTALILLPLFHVYANFLTGCALVDGCKIVLQERFVPDNTLDIIQKHKVTNFPVVPPLALFLAEHPLIGKYDISSLKSIMTGAAPVSPKKLELLADRLKLSYVGQGYGATEFCPISITPKKCTDLSTSGRIVCNTELRVVSLETGEDVSAGLPGEIYVRGAHMMSGYDNNPHATQSTIVDGWLKSGDIGRISEDGFVYIEDRLKDFIKVKGHQVAPSELEALLMTNPLIQDAAVIGINDDKSGEVPKAFVVLKDKNLQPEEIKRYVAERTSKEKHLVGGVVILDQIPKSASGKILKKNLRSLSSV